MLKKELLLKQISVHSLPELEALLTRAVESLNAGKGVDAEKVFDNLRKSSKARRNNG